MIPENVSSLVDYITSDVNETNSECFWAVRYQLIKGEVWKSTNPSSDVRKAIDRIRIGSPFKLGVDGIENRLLKLLTYLQQEKPDDGWSAFLEKGEVNWRRVVLAGHSQGGGHAVMMSMLHSVHRVAQLSSVCDISPWTDGRYCQGASLGQAACHGVQPPAQGYYGVIQTTETDICNKSVAEYHWRQLSKGDYSLGGVSEAIKHGFRFIDSTYLPNTRCMKWLSALRENHCTANNKERASIAKPTSPSTCQRRQTCVCQATSAMPRVSGRTCWAGLLHSGSLSGS